MFYLCCGTLQLHDSGLLLYVIHYYIIIIIFHSLALTSLRSNKTSSSWNFKFINWALLSISISLPLSSENCQKEFIERIGYVPSLFGKRFRYCTPFFQCFWHNPALIDHSELNVMMPSFSKLNNEYFCLWVIFNKYILHVIVTKSYLFRTLL